MPGSERQNSMFKKSTGYVQKNNPFDVTSCGRRRNIGTPLFAKAEPRRTIGRGKNFNKVSKDKSAEGGAAGGGMTQKGVNEYKRKQLLQKKILQKKMLQDVSLFVLDQEVGKAKEVKRLDVDGGVKINNYE